MLLLRGYLLTVISEYEDRYNTYGSVSYFDNFERKQYRKSLTSLEVNGISDVAVFADGTEYVTVDINLLDLSNKDFWKNDEQEIYETMRVYDEVENDSVKQEQYLYDYIYKQYVIRSGNGIRNYRRI